MRYFHGGVDNFDRAPKADGGSAASEGKVMIVRVVPMLIKLAVSFEDAMPADDRSGV